MQERKIIDIVAEAAKVTYLATKKVKAWPQTNRTEKDAVANEIKRLHAVWWEQNKHFFIKK